MPSGWSDSSTERFPGWDIIPTQVPYICCPFILKYFGIVVGILVYISFRRTILLKMNPTTANYDEPQKEALSHLENVFLGETRFLC
jgi:hypothetical protein